MYSDMQKKCVFCGESIPAVAGRCPYCGSVLEAPFDNNLRPGMEKNEEGKQPYAGPGEYGAEEPAQDPAAEQYIPENTDQGHAASGKTGAAYEPQEGPGPWTEQGYQYRYDPQPGYGRTPLSNGMKVFLTVLFAILPGLGQLAGIITAIVFMSSDRDSDRRSFGLALLVANVVLFVLACISCFILSIVGQSMYNLP